jgi:hypothetical protein
MEMGLSLLADRMNFTFSAWLMTFPSAFFLPLMSTFDVLTMWSAITAVTKEPPRVSSNMESLTLSWPIDRPSALSFTLEMIEWCGVDEWYGLKVLTLKVKGERGGGGGGGGSPGELNQCSDSGGSAHIVEQHHFARVQLFRFVVSAPLERGGGVRCDLQK